MKTIGRLFALVLIAFTAHIACGETLPEIVVTGVRTPLESAKLPSASTVISRAEIEQLQVNTLPEVLSGVAGIDMVNSGGYGKQTSIYVRGMNADHVLVLIDGVRMGSATIGTVAFQDLPLAQVERIEIVRGPHSSVWGSDALGGVIQIFTKKGADGLSYSFNAGAGSYDTYTASGNVSGEYHGFHYSGGISYLDTGGFDARQPTTGFFGVDEPDDDGYDNLSFQLRGGYRFGDTIELEGFMLRAFGETEFDDNFENSSEYVEQVTGGSLIIYPVDLWKSKLTVSESRDESDNFTPAGDFSSRFDTKRFQVNWQNDVSLGDNHQVILGMDYRNDKIDSTTVFAETERDDLGVYGEYLGSYGGLQLIGSLRWDDNEAFGEETTGSIGGSYQWDNGTRLYVSYGTAYKTPSFNDLYWPSSIFAAGNPDLKPESSDAVQGGIAGDHPWGGWDIRAYHTRVEDLIEWGLDAATFIFIPQNINDATITGVEAEITADLGNWDTSLALDYVDHEDDATGDWLPRRAKRSLTYALNYNTGSWRLGARLLARGHRFDDATNNVRVGGFATVDLLAEYRINGNLSLRAKAANLLDREYQTIDTFNSADRNFFVSVHYRSK